MRLILLLILLGFSMKAQIPVDTVMLCNDLNKSYYVKYNNGMQTIWTIEPEIPFIGQTTENIDLTFESLGTYILSASQTNGFCTSDPSYLLIAVVPCVETTAYIPNAFTPDGDGLNETFGLEGENIKNYRMEIYDRWGELLFVTTDITKQWEGPDTITDKDSFVYSYKINYQDVKNKYYELYGRITLVK